MYAGKSNKILEKSIKHNAMYFKPVKSLNQFTDRTVVTHDDKKCNNIQFIESISHPEFFRRNIFKSLILNNSFVVDEFQFILVDFNFPGV